MILVGDMNAVVVDALAGQASALPGGAWPNRGPDAPTAYPYVVFRWEVGDAEHTSGPAYYQKWRLYAAAYVQLGSSGSVLQAQQALAAALCAGAAPPTVRTLRNATERVLQAVPVSGDEEYDDRLRDGRDLLLAWQAAELYVQGDRTVA